MEGLTVEGERFVGKFKADKRTGEFWGGSEYTEYKYTGFWYEGAGIIEDKNTNKKYFFALKTNHLRDWHNDNYNLEESIVNLDKKESPVINGMYKKIVDLVFDDMVLQAESSGEDIPTVTPKKLKLEDLFEMGYCADKNRQIHLTFSR